MTDMSESDMTGVHLMADAYKRWANMPPVRLTMERGDAFTVLMGLQTVASQHDLPRPLAELMEATGRVIQEAVCDSPDLYLMAEAEWNRALDMDPKAPCTDGYPPAHRNP